MSVDILGQAVTNAEAWFSIALRPRKPEVSLGRTAQDVHLDSHTAPELCFGIRHSLSLIRQLTSEDIKHQLINTLRMRLRRNSDTVLELERLFYTSWCTHVVPRRQDRGNSFTWHQYNNYNYYRNSAAATSIGGY